VVSVAPGLGGTIFLKARSNVSAFSSLSHRGLRRQRARCGEGVDRCERILEAQVEELRADVSKGYARGYYHGRFTTYTG